MVISYRLLEQSGGKKGMIYSEPRMGLRIIASVSSIGENDAYEVQEPRTGFNVNSHGCKPMDRILCKNYEP